MNRDNANRKEMTLIFYDSRKEGCYLTVIVNKTFVIVVQIIIAEAIDNSTFYVNKISLKLELAFLKGLFAFYCYWIISVIKIKRNDMKSKCGILDFSLWRNTVIMFLGPICVDIMDGK